MSLKTCVLPNGRFLYGIHKPSFNIANLRKNSFHSNLGEAEDGSAILNSVNFPEGAVSEAHADWIFEIPNPFPFRGTTYIARRWAEKKATRPETICLPEQESVSLKASMQKFDTQNAESLSQMIRSLPEPLQIALASTSTDRDDLTALARICCEFIFDKTGTFPTGLKYTNPLDGNPQPIIHNRPLFEVVANNPNLPDEYKDVMVLRPGVQGSSEIIGEWQSEEGSHIFEYLRRNSYIPWGHFAANMANDAIRYNIKDLNFRDITGLRHLYYQRILVGLANQLEIKINTKQESVAESELELIRQQILKKLENSESIEKLSFDRTLWGWNFGFDYAPSHYRLHASHQQIHQQYAMIPNSVPTWQGGTDNNDKKGSFSPYACGELVEDFIERYREQTGHSFFEAYINALKSNKRMDGRADRPQDLIIYNQDDVILFVPKAQTSQWELQLMPLKPIGNILEADTKTRCAINKVMFVAVNVLSALGARMITSFEYSKKFLEGPIDQRLLYSFQPRLPESPGAFSEAQLRWINGHYPEDFAAACKLKLPEILSRIDN